MTSPFSSRIAVLFLTVLLGGVVAACSDDGVAPRPSVEGLYIRVDQNTVVAEVTADGQATGLLAVDEGQRSEVFFIVFTDIDGLPLEPEDDEFVILRGYDDTIVTVDQVTPGSPGFQIEGLQGGQTSLTIELAEGDPSDPASSTTVYVTPEPVPVGVTGIV